MKKEPKNAVGTYCGICLKGRPSWSQAARCGLWSILQPKKLHILHVLPPNMDSSTFAHHYICMASRDMGAKTGDSSQHITSKISTSQLNCDFHIVLLGECNALWGDHERG